MVLLHDPFWTPRGASRAAHECGAAVIAVHHSSAALHAAGLPGPDAVYARALRRWYRRAYLDVDAVMSVVDTVDRRATPGDAAPAAGARAGLSPPARDPRGDHVLYVGRLSREKGLRELLDAAAASTEPWPLVLLGTGPDGRRAARARPSAGAGRAGDASTPTCAIARRWPSALPPRAASSSPAPTRRSAWRRWRPRRAPPRSSPPSRRRRHRCSAAASTPSGPGTAPTCCARSSGRGGGRPTSPRRGPAGAPGTAGSRASRQELADLERLLGR